MRPPRPSRNRKPGDRRRFRGNSRRRNERNGNSSRQQKNIRDLKQLSVIFHGDYNTPLFKNFLTYKVGAYNMQHIAPSNPDITGSIDILPNGELKVIYEGKEEDITAIHEQTKRGPMISFVKSCDTNMRQGTGQYKTFRIKKSRR